MSNYQASVTLRVEASQFMSTLDQVNQKMQQTGQSGEQMAQKSQTAGSRLDGFTSSLKNMVSPMMAISGGVIGLAQNYIALERAGVMTERMQNRLTQAHMATQKAQEAYDRAVQAGLQNTQQGAKLLEALNLAKSKEATASDASNIAQERYNVTMANFVDNIMPQALSILGGVTGVLQVFEGRSNLAAKSAEGMGQKFLNATSNIGGMGGAFGGLGSSMLSFVGGPVGAALIGIGLLVTALIMIRENTFGVRDALNGMGKAMGDAVPALRPLLEGIKGFGYAVLGIADDTKKGTSESASELKRWVDQVNTMGKDLDTKQYEKFWNDLGKFMTDNFQSNVRGFQGILDGIGKNIKSNIDGWGRTFNTLGGLAAAGLAGVGKNIQSNVDGWGKIFAGAWGIISSGAGLAWGAITKAFAGAGSWFVSNVEVPIKNAWTSTLAFFNQIIPDPIKKAFADTVSWFEKNVSGPLMAIWGGVRDFFANNVIKPLYQGFEKAGEALGGLAKAVTPPSAAAKLPPAAPSAPTLSGRGTPQAPYAPTPSAYYPYGSGGGGQYQQIIATPETSPWMAKPAAKPFQPGVTGLTISGTQPLTGGYIEKILPDFASLDQKQKDATASALEFARVHHITIPAGFTGSSKAIQEFMSPLQKEATQFQDDYTAAASYLTEHNLLTPALAANKQATIDTANADKDYQKALNAVADSNKKANIEISATQTRLDSGRAINEDFTKGVLTQTKALQDMQEQHLTNAGSLATYNEQIAHGTIQQAAYNLAIDDQKKALNDAWVAIATTQGKIDELNRQLATGVPQVQAYIQGFQSIQQEMQKMVTDTANTRGQVDALDQALSSGEAIAKSYAQGIAEGALAFDKWKMGLASSIGNAQEMNFRLQEMAKQYGALPPGMELTNENLKKFNELSAEARAGIPGAAEELRKFAQGFDLVSKTAQGMTDMVAKQFDDLSKKVKKPLDEIPQYIRQAMGPDVLAHVLDEAKAQAMFGAKGISEAFASELKYAGTHGAGQFLEGLKVADKGMAAEFDKIGQLMQIGTAEAVGAAVRELNKLGPKGQEAAKMLVQAYARETGTQLDAVTGQAVSNVSVDPFSTLGSKAGQAFVNAYNQNISKMQALPPAQKGGWGIGTITSAMQAGEQTKGAQGGQQVDTASATTALQQLQVLATSVFRSIAVQAAGAAAAMNQQISRGANDAAGLFTMLQSHAQTVMNALAAMPAGVASAINSNFSKGLNDAAGLYTTLQSHAQSAMNAMARMPTGVATAMNSSFSRGANDAAGYLNQLVGKAASAFASVISSANKAAAAVAAVAKAITALPNKTVTITVNNSQALSAIRATQSAINSLHGTTITNTVITVHKTINQVSTQLIGPPTQGQIETFAVHEAANINLGAPVFMPSATTTSTTAAAGPVVIVVNIGGREVWREVRKSLFENISQY